MGGLLFLLLSGLQPTAHQRVDQYHLEKEWEIYLGPATRSVYRTAVCPDGRANLTSSDGRLVIISSSGEIRSDEMYPELEGTIATACDSSGRVCAGTGDRRLVTIGPLATRGRSAEVTNSTLKFRIRNMIPAEIGELIAITDDQSRTFLRRLNMYGDTIGEFDTYPGNRTASRSRRATVEGSILWDPAQRGLVFLPLFPYKFHVYDAKGRMVREMPREDSAFTPGEDRMPGDEVVRAHRLPDGRIITQILKMTLVGSKVYRSNNYLEIFDTTLGLSGFCPETYGFLQGIDASGNLYFQRIVTDGPIFVIKARLGAETRR